MTNVIKFPQISDGSIGGAALQTVDARELHAFLEVGKDFSTWIKGRIEQYGFVEGVDFAKFEDLRSPNSGSSKARPQTTIEYAISLDMGKELGMVENNDRGRQVRRHFIQCERRAKDPREALNDLPTLRSLLLDKVDEVIALQGQVSELLPSKQALDRIAVADGSLCLTEAAKSLQMRPKDLFSWMRQNGWIYRRPGSRHDLGYQTKTSAGYLEHKVGTVPLEDGTEKVTEQVRVTPKGLAKLASLVPHASPMLQ